MRMALQMLKLCSIEAIEMMRKQLGARVEMMNDLVINQQTAISNRYAIPQAFKIIEIKNENASTKTFVLDGKLDAQPGQFLMVWLPFWP